MLNPSIAGSTVNDHTIKKCIGFAKKNDYAGIEVVNLFPLVSTAQATLATYDGSSDETHNLVHIADTARRVKMVLAFGNIAKSNRQRQRALSLALDEIKDCVTLSIGTQTNTGYPYHPRNPGYTTPLVLFNMRSMRG
jgi:hypothetical protein